MWLLMTGGDWTGLSRGSLLPAGQVSGSAASTLPVPMMRSLLGFAWGFGS